MISIGCVPIEIEIGRAGPARGPLREHALLFGVTMSMPVRFLLLHHGEIDAAVEPYSGSFAMTTPAVSWAAVLDGRHRIGSLTDRPVAGADHCLWRAFSTLRGAIVCRPLTQFSDLRIALAAHAMIERSRGGYARDDGHVVADHVVESRALSMIDERRV